jgi:hypothetical protein
MNESNWNYKDAGRLIRLGAWLTLGFAVFCSFVIRIDSWMGIGQLVIDTHDRLTAVFIVSTVTLLHLIISDGINQHRTWGRTAGIMLAIIYLPGIPIGTLMGILIIIHLIKGWDT